MDPFLDPMMDPEARRRMEEQLRAKALESIAQESASQDAAVEAIPLPPGVSPRPIRPEVRDYVAKRNNLAPPMRMTELEVRGRTPGAVERQRTQTEEDLRDARESAAADEYGRGAAFIAGTGKTGQMLAQAFGAKNADPNAFDGILKDADARRAAVGKYMRDKVLAKQGHALDLEKLGVQQQGQKDLAQFNAGADMDKARYMASEEWRRLQAQLEAEKTKAKAAGDAKRLEEIAKVEEGLRKELTGNQVTKDAQQTAIAFEKVKSGLSANTAAGDMAGIFAFMKILDPGSSVREGEYANAQNAGGVPERIIAMYNKAVDGRLLDGDQRKDFLARAEQLYQANAGQYRKLADQYTGLARGSGADPSRVVLDLGFDQQAGAAPPRVTTEADYNALPPGSQYVAPDGSVRRKK